MSRDRTSWHQGVSQCASKWNLTARGKSTLDVTLCSSKVKDHKISPAGSDQGRSLLCVKHYSVSQNGKPDAPRKPHKQGMKALEQRSLSETVCSSAKPRCWTELLHMLKIHPPPKKTGAARRWSCKARGSWFALLTAAMRGFKG